jgi:dTDP-4-amino-4,6-dideoxygalactose transaminase
LNKTILAIYGGPKIRNKPLPYRKLFGEDELDYVKKVFKNSWKIGKDFGYQEKFEEIYTQVFCKFQGGGFADGVCSGTAALFIALKSLEIEKRSDVIVSPVTDPGSISPIIILGMKPIISDSAKNSYNVGPAEFEKALTPKTRAAILTHLGGTPFDIKPILEIATDKGIKIIEDCSQAHGALYNGEKVGRFGDTAAFSTMFSKIHSTGGCGGVIYTKDENYYWKIRSYADRGKPFNKSDFDLRRPSEFLFPALNFNLDELSAAIGVSTLSKLQETIDKRLEIVKKINGGLKKSSVVTPPKIEKGTKPSIFFHTVEVDISKLKVTKKKFAEAIASEGIWINPDYKYVVSEWNWIKKYINRKKRVTPNAIDYRNKTFNILFNERFKDKEINDILQSILKVETVLTKT